MTANNGFLPDDYEVPKGESDYVKLEEGENRMRILSKAMVGWSYWNLQNKPIRIAGVEKPNIDKSLIQTDTYGFQNLHHFWAFVVFSYKSNSIKVFELTQPSIQKRIKELALSPDWGSPFGYDIIINRFKESGKTKYSTTPVPPKPVLDIVKSAYKAKPCNLNALLVGGNPFEVNGAPAPSAEALASIQAPTQTPATDALVNNFSVENPDPLSGLPF